MKKFGVMGWPVKHSLSPVMHEAAFAELGINARYLQLEVPPSEVAETVKWLPSQGFAGWNVTVPHKHEVCKCMDRLDPGAALVGSVNTVVVEADSGQCKGYSTDGYGLAMAVHEHFGFDPSGNSIAFLGGGGAVFATAVYLARHGLAEIVLINRTRKKIESIAKIITEIAPDCRVVCLDLADRTGIGRALQPIPLLIQATSLGLQSDDPLPLDPGIVPETTDVMDMIYGETAFIKALRKGGRKTADGMAMLLYQGARSFTLWTGLEPPLGVMREALQRAMQTRMRTGGEENSY